MLCVELSLCNLRRWSRKQTVDKYTHVAWTAQISEGHVGTMYLILMKVSSPSPKTMCDGRNTLTGLDWKKLTTPTGCEEGSMKMFWIRCLKGTCEIPLQKIHCIDLHRFTQISDFPILYFHLYLIQIKAQPVEQSLQEKVSRHLGSQKRFWNVHFSLEISKTILGNPFPATLTNFSEWMKCGVNHAQLDEFNLIVQTSPWTWFMFPWMFHPRKTDLDKTQRETTMLLQDLKRLLDQITFLTGWTLCTNCPSGGIAAQQLRYRSPLPPPTRTTPPANPPSHPDHWRTLRVSSSLCEIQIVICIYFFRRSLCI